MIPYGRQNISQVDIDAVVEVLRSDFITCGPVVPAFEKAIALRVGVKYALSVNSSTSALHLACLALGLGEGDRLWTVPNTFVASANCGRFCGADIDFVDIDSTTYNMDINALKTKLNLARENNTLPKIVIPVHFSGQPTEQEVIWDLAQEYGFKIIEDASHAIGASRNNEYVGSCKWSDITVFSFHPVKIITTGEGGVALTNDKNIFSHMEILRSHGITRNLEYMQNEPLGPWYYEQIHLGFNYRMSDIQAALGLSQLNRLEQFIGKRNEIAKQYDCLLRDLPIQKPKVLPENRSSFHLYVIRLEVINIKKTHREVFEFLRKNGIGVNLHYMPVHLQPYYQQLGFAKGMYPEAERYSEEAISLPIYPDLTFKNQKKIVEILREALQ